MITPTSVEPYMLRGVTPKVSWMNLQVEMSMGSPVKESLAGRNGWWAARPEARRSR